MNGLSDAQKWKTVRNELCSTTALIWIGLILGVSFYAAPIKFTAEGVSRESLLLVGQVTFQGFAWIEWVVFLALFLSAFGGFRRTMILLVVAVGVVMIIQKFLILPPLDSLLTEIVAGRIVKDNLLHSFYIGSEVIKLVLLIILAIRARIVDSTKS